MELSEKTKLCGAFLILHVVISFFIVAPGHFSVDEVLYHMMTKNFVETGSMEIWNGYEEFASPELVIKFTSVHNGKLFPQYPYLYPVLAAPFYYLAGYRGVFFLNAMAFIGVAFLTYRICEKFFNDKNMSLNACLILSLGTYAWGYSQAAWPHMTAAFFVISSFYLFLCAFYGDSPEKSFYYALACGLISGLSLGIRLDSIFVLPCFMFAFVFLKPWRPVLFWWIIIGTIPGLILLSATNYVKFGVISPFSYGRNVENFTGLSEIFKYFPLLLLFLGVLFFLWIATRYPVILKLQKKITGCALVLLVFVLFMIPEVKAMVWKTLNGAYQLLIDFRIRGLGIKDVGLIRTEGGAIVYLDGLKKSLLQSCPYLVILVIPFLKIFKNGKSSQDLILLFLIPVTYVGFYSYSGGWHGGQSLNLRYFVPILPFMVILAAFSWKRLTSFVMLPENSPFYSRLFFAVFIMTLLFHLYLRITLVSPDAQEYYCLNVPMILSGVSLFLIFLHYVFYDMNWALIYRTTITILLISMIWSGVMGVLYDYIYHHGQRRYNLKQGTLASEYISDDAIVFTDYVDAFAHLIETRKIRIASPLNDDFRDFHKLAAFHFQKKRDVYVAFQSFLWYQLKNMGLFDNYNVRYYEKSDMFIVGQLFSSTAYENQ